MMLLAFVAISLALAISCRQKRTTHLSTIASGSNCGIYGIVYDGDSRIPISVATLTLMANDGLEIGTVITGDDGYYAFNNLPYSYSYKLRVTVQGYPTFERHGIDLLPFSKLNVPVFMYQGEIPMIINPAPSEIDYSNIGGRTIIYQQHDSNVPDIIHE